MKLSIKGLALTAAILWALCTLVLSITVSQWGWGSECLKIISSMYLGYDTTLTGTVIGIVWGFADGLVSGAIFAWLYNKLA